MAGEDAGSVSFLSYPWRWQALSNDQKPPITGIIQPVVLVAPPKKEEFDAFKILWIPLGLIIASLLLKQFFDFLVGVRNKYRLCAAASDEIERMRNSYEKYRNVFIEAYGSRLPTSFFSARIAADPRYYPYVVKADPTLSLLTVDGPPDRLLFLKQATIKAICAYQSACTLLANQIDDLRSDNFRDLSPERKLDVFKAIIKLYDDVNTTYYPCRTALDEEYTSRRRSIWYPFILLADWEDGFRYVYRYIRRKVAALIKGLKNPTTESL